MPPSATFVPVRGTFSSVLLNAGWGSPLYEDVPAEHRAVVARYVDEIQDLVGWPQVDELREAAIAGGASAVDQLVQYRTELVRRHHIALDQLHIDLSAVAEDLPEWALALLDTETLDLHQTRDELHSAIVSYHHGVVLPGPDHSGFANISYSFTTGSVELAR